MDRYWRDYLPDQTARENRLAVPMLADPTGLPPLYIAACEFDPLLDDSRRLAERAKTANVDVEFRVWNGMVHGALSLMGWIDAMGSHVDHIGGFLRRVTQA
jgi:acetyl esterase/lipase